jgi:HD superfamily phosphohydrolase
MRYDEAALSCDNIWKLELLNRRPVVKKRPDLAQRSYRDPLHNIISLDESSREDRLLIDLIDSAEFQRLRRIRQLGLAMFTYQGAEHSRFTHSLGVMHLMTRALDRLSDDAHIQEEDRLAGRAAALLHDLGHGPFSHLIEKIFGFKHEEWTLRIILDESTEVYQILRDCDPSLPEKLCLLYQHKSSPAFVGQLVSSQLDCDRMDYLLRDSLMTGVKYGIFDLEWVLHTLRIDQATDRIYVESRGIHAVEEYLQARYYMFRQVYLHRTLRSAEAVLILALNRAAEIVNQGPGLPAIDGLLEKMISGGKLSAAEYLKLDDSNLIFCLKQWASHSDPILSDLSQRFINRKLFKAIDLDLPTDRLQEFADRAASTISGLGMDPRYYLFLDRASDVPYYGYYLPGQSDPKGLIYVETGGTEPEIREISEVSEIVRAMRAYRIDRACFPMEAYDPIRDLLMDMNGHPAIP